MIAAWSMVALAALLLVIAPLARVAVGIANAAPADPPRTQSWVEWSWLLAQTAVVAVGLALVITAAAWPVAWGLRFGRGGWGGWVHRSGWAWLAVPLLVPSYMPYAALQAARGPGTWIGGLVERGPDWLGPIVTRTLGLGGMVLWLWPLAVIVLAAGLRSVPAGAVDQLALEPGHGAARWHKAATRLAMGRSAAASAFAAVALAVLGSAIPLHLAQVPTFAIWLWRELDLTPDPSTVWLKATPLLVVALLAAIWVNRRLGHWTPAESGEDRTPPSAGKGWSVWLVWACFLWSASVLVPLGIFVWTLREAALLERFWRETGYAVGSSSLLAGAVGLGGVALTLAVWSGLTLDGGHYRGWRDRAAAAILGGLVFMAVIPGVMVGSVFRQISQWVPVWLGEGPGMLWLAHLARFGAFAALAGIMLARGEPQAQRLLRLNEGATTAWAFWRAVVRPRWGTLLGIGLTMAALSLQEIEAAVILQPPGMPSLPRVLLEQLHYLRDQQMAAASVNLITLTMVLAWSAGRFLSSSVDSDRSAPVRGT